MGARVKDPSTGQFKEMYVKALDSLPVGAEIDFDGDSADIPDGWEEVSGKSLVSYELYSGNSTSGNLTISNDISNYKKVEVTAQARNGVRTTFVLYEPSEKIIEIKTGNAETGLIDYYIFTACTLAFSGTTVTRANTRVVQLRNNTSLSIGTDDSYYTLGIVKIIGYKEV